MGKACFSLSSLFLFFQEKPPGADWREDLASILVVVSLILLFIDVFKGASKTPTAPIAISHNPLSVPKLLSRGNGGIHAVWTKPRFHMGRVNIPQQRLRNFMERRKYVNHIVIMQTKIHSPCEDDRVASAGKLYTRICNK